MVGQGESDLESAHVNGALQCQHATSLLEDSSEHTLLRPTIKVAFRYVDFACAPVDPEFGEGCVGGTTEPAVIGISMAEGTAEGPGPLYRLRGLTSFLNACVRTYSAFVRLMGPPSASRPLASRGAKFPMFEPGRGAHGRFLGIFSQAWGALFSRLDPTIARLYELRSRGLMGQRAWTPHVLPLQLVQLGSMALVALPFEPTTVAGRRIKRLVATRLKSAGVEHVVVVGYANAYCGYLTTHEEYNAQRYEGASTYMGAWTLGATLTQLSLMVADMLRPEDSVSTLELDRMRPAPFAEHVLKSRAISLDSPLEEDLASLGFDA